MSLCFSLPITRGSSILPLSLFPFCVNISGMNQADFKFVAIRIASNILIFGAITILYLTYGAWAKDNLLFIATKARGVSYQLSTNSDNPEDPSLLTALKERKPLAISPVNSDFALVIPQIGLSVPVVKNTSVTDKAKYLEALKFGVAHAKGTVLPGEIGNSYYFSHSSLNFWELGSYATSFNLLNRITPGSDIYVFYQGKQYQYRVLQTEIVKGWDTVPYYREFVKPMLTLQTCSPPGTTINRLLILAELVEQ